MYALQLMEDGSLLGYELVPEEKLFKFVSHSQNVWVTRTKETAEYLSTSTSMYDENGTVLNEHAGNCMVVELQIKPEVEN